MFYVVFKRERCVNCSIFGQDTIVGFDDLGGRDDFPIEVLEWRLGLSKVINYTGDCQGPIQKSGYSGIFMPVKKGGIRGGGGDSDDDDD